MRRLSLLISSFLCCVLIGISFIDVKPVYSADFTVSTVDELVEAIKTANNNAEADTIYLTANIFLTAVDNVQNGNNGLPIISSEIILNGNGFTISGDPAGTPFRILFVSETGNLQLIDVTLSNGNAMADSGGAIRNLGTLTLINTTLSHNYATNGGGIWNQGDLFVIDSVFTNNDSGYAGAIFNTGDQTTIINSIFSQNSANSPGGAIYGAGEMTIRNSLFDQNDTQSRGGAIYSYKAITIENSTFTGNTARLGGAGVALYTESPTIDNSTFYGNFITGNGSGAAILTESDMTITNSTISGNITGANGGGIAVLDGTLTVINSTITENDASTAGSGIYSTALSVTLVNTIIGGHPFSEDYSASGVTVLTTNGVNIVEDGTIPASANVLNVDPLLAPIANNGGTTQTHALQAGSPAIDASGAGATLSDQRGVLAIGTRDIGAFEFGGTVNYPVVEFASTGASYYESDGTVAIPMSVSGGAGFSGIGTVYVTDFQDGTATSGLDYTPVPLTAVTIDCTGGTCPATVFLNVDILSDAIVEPDETFLLRIVGTDGFVTLGNTTLFTGVIMDDPIPTPTPTETGEPTPTETGEPAPTETVEPTSTETVEPTPTETVEPTPTITPTGDVTVTPIPTDSTGSTDSPIAEPTNNPDGSSTQGNIIPQPEDLGVAELPLTGETPVWAYYLRLLLGWNGDK